MIPTSKSHYSINFPDSEEQSLFQNYREQVEMILDNQDEPNLIIRIDKFDFPILECKTLTDFIEDVLKPITQKAANKRHINYENALELISGRTNLNELIWQ